jgi:hypothetical protein
LALCALLSWLAAQNVFFAADIVKLCHWWHHSLTVAPFSKEGHEFCLADAV